MAINMAETLNTNDYDSSCMTTYDRTYRRSYRWRDHGKDRPTKRRIDRVTDL